MSTSLHNFLKGDASVGDATSVGQGWNPESSGPYVGIVKGNKDPTRMGRLRVYIPTLAKTVDPTEQQLITCEYLSPFYGAKGSRYTDGNSTEFEATQHSYGFWGVPPDLDTRVLVIFAEGKSDQAYWIGCIQDPYTNHMVPGIASSENTWDKRTGGAGNRSSAGVDKIKTYGSTEVPSAELNRSNLNALQNGDYESIPKAIHPFVEILKSQGLSADKIRGTTTSSARRESPSQVFGISTPGRKDTSKTKKPVGTSESTATDYVTRNAGHTFVMDDGDENGDNQLTRIRTASGHQLLMHASAGVVYLANGSGDSWLEFTQEGKIYVYAENGMSLRAGGDFNLHSDKDITFHARNDIKFTAESNVVVNAEKTASIMGKDNVLVRSEGGAVRTAGLTGISSYTPGTQLHGAGGRIDLAGSQVHFNSVGANSSWGPVWMTPESMNIATQEEANDVDLTALLLQANTADTKTTVPVNELVTHEPFIRVANSVSGGKRPWEYGTAGKADKLKVNEWKKLSQTPGTPEYMAQELRNKKGKIADNQFKADLRDFEKTKVASGVTKNKLTDIQTKDDFISNYNEVYGVDTVKLNEKKTQTTREVKTGFKGWLNKWVLGPKTKITETVDRTKGYKKKISNTGVSQGATGDDDF